MAKMVDAFMSTRRVGDTEISIVYELSGASTPELNVTWDELEAAEPEIASGGPVPMAVTSTVVKTDRAVVVIDPALDDPDSRLDRAMTARTPEWTRGPGLQAGLGALGISNEQVTHVIITHAHWDHCLGITVERDGVYLPRFPQARHFLGSADWQRRPAPDSEPPSREESVYERFQHREMWPRLGAIEAAGLLETVEGVEPIAPGIDLLHAPGETPGHCVVRVSSGDETFYHLGDIVHFWFEFAHPDWIVVDSLARDLPTMEATRQALMPQVAAEDAVAFYSHAPHPGWGRLISQAESFRWAPL